jgi:hypothetical protein
VGKSNGVHVSVPSIGKHMSSQFVQSLEAFIQLIDTHIHTHTHQSGMDYMKV